jgi:hypothetical protein
MATMMSPGAMPASSAGPPGTTGLDEGAVVDREVVDPGGLRYHLDEIAAEVGIGHPSLVDDLEGDPRDGVRRDGEEEPLGRDPGGVCGMPSVFTPITRPLRSKSGPPELPGLIAALCWIRLV